MSLDKDYDFLSADDSFAPQQWEFANNGLMRQISVDQSEPIFLDPISVSPIEESSSQTSWLESFHSDTETGLTIASDSTETKRRRKEKDSNYEKNICAYITKKAVQCLLAADYRTAVKKLCAKHGCDFDYLQSYYGQRYKEVFGITHLTLLISPQSENELAMKKVFRTFLKWFLREKYMFYLLKYGKMSDKEKYVEFKNKYLLFIDEQIIGTNTQSSSIQRG